MSAGWNALKRILLGSVFQFFDICGQDVFQRDVQCKGCFRQIPGHIPQFLGKVLFVQLVPLSQPLFHNVDGFP